MVDVRFRHTVPGVPTMALVLPHSIFFHVGRTAGHCVRKAIRATGIPTREAGGFHDWPSNVSLDAEDRRKRFFCFVRHPLTWLRSYWCHHMQFGWGADEFSNALRSDTFAHFLERALVAWPGGAATATFRPFVTQCRDVGRQEHLVADLHRILTQAGEPIAPTPTETGAVTTVAVDRRITAAATAPRALLERVLESEAETCHRFGYDDVPESLIGPAGTCTAIYLPLGTAAHPFTADEEVLRSTAHGFLIDDRAYPTTNRSPTLTMAIRDAIASLDLVGRDVVDVHCEDGALCFFAESRGADRVVGVTNDLPDVTANLAAALDSKVAFLRHGCYGVEQTLDRPFDVVLCCDHLHTTRHPSLLVRTLSRLMKEGGTLLLATQYLAGLTDIPLMYLPVGTESPQRAEDCSFFNVVGLGNLLTAYGFHDFRVHADLPMAAPRERAFARMPFDPGRVYHDSESALATLVMTCRWAPAIADEDPRYAADRAVGRSLVAAWDSEFPPSGLPESVATSRMLVMLDAQVHRHRDAAVRLEQELETAAAALRDREQELDRTRFELVDRTAALDDARADLTGRTAELDAARQDLRDRTEDLVRTRHDLIDRTRRLERAEEKVRWLAAALAEAHRFPAPPHPAAGPTLSAAAAVERVGSGL